MSQTLAAIILAAGAGTRMKSKLPKVMHPCCGVPLMNHVVRLAIKRKHNPIVVVVSPDNGNRIRELLVGSFPDTPLKFVVQATPRGTGDAVRVGLDAIPKFKGQVVILSGDVPLITAATLNRLNKASAKVSMGLLTSEFPDMTGYGRIIRNKKAVLRIVEERDCNSEEKKIIEGNAGVYQCDSVLIRHAVKRLKSNNSQGEFYLTDIVEMAANEKGAVGICVSDWKEVMGVNTLAQLALVESTYRSRMIAELQNKGTTFLDPKNTFLDADITIAKDVIIGVGVQLYGKSVIKSGVRIDGPTYIKNCTIDSNARVYSFSHLENAYVGKETGVGPYARLRPGTHLELGSKVGNFVELKNSRLGKGAKANHLAYVGDAFVGSKSNIGAGTITCNYDGMNKSKTILGEEVFVGSNCTLVAPLEIGDGSYIAAGSTVTKKAPADALVIGRTRQVNREGYAALLKERIRRRREENKGN